MESESGREAEGKTGNCGWNQRVAERPREGQGPEDGLDQGVRDVGRLSATNMFKSCQRDTQGNYG